LTTSCRHLHYDRETRNWGRRHRRADDSYIGEVASSNDSEEGIDGEDLEEAEAEDDSTKSHTRHLGPEHKRHLRNRTIY